MTGPTDRWADLRQFVNRQLHDYTGMRSDLADLMAERDRYRSALEAIERLHTTSWHNTGCAICFPADGGWPCCTLREIHDALTEETTDD